MSLLISLAVLSFAFLAALVWLRGRSNSKFEVKLSDAFIAVIPVLLGLLFTGQIKKLVLGTEGITIETAGQALVFQQQREKVDEIYELASKIKSDTAYGFVANLTIPKIGLLAKDTMHYEKFGSIYRFDADGRVKVLNVQLEFLKQVVRPFANCVVSSQDRGNTIFIKNVVGPVNYAYVRFLQLLGSGAEQSDLSDVLDHYYAAATRAASVLDPKSKDAEGCGRVLDGKWQDDARKKFDGMDVSQLIELPYLYLAGAWMEQYGRSYVSAAKILDSYMGINGHGRLKSYVRGRLKSYVRLDYNLLNVRLFRAYSFLGMGLPVEEVLTEFEQVLLELGNYLRDLDRSSVPGLDELKERYGTAQLRLLGQVTSIGSLAVLARLELSEKWERYVRVTGADFERRWKKADARVKDGPRKLIFFQSLAVYKLVQAHEETSDKRTELVDQAKGLLDQILAAYEQALRVSPDAKYDEGLQAKILETRVIVEYIQQVFD